MIEPDGLTLRQVRRAFGDNVVLDGIDLEVPAGQFVALLGHSGCGKSTLLRVIAGLDREAEGDVDAPRCAVVFQEPRLLPWKRVLPNVTLGLKAAGATARGRAVLADVGLATHEKAWPYTLSGGEAQRVSLARALVRNPKLLLLDEPFGALDALTRIKMQLLLIDMCAKYAPTVLFVTHDVEEALLLADRVVVLAGGRFVHDEPVTFPSPRRRADLDFQTMRERVMKVLGVVDEMPHHS